MTGACTPLVSQARAVAINASTRLIGSLGFGSFGSAIEVEVEIDLDEIDLAEILSNEIVLIHSL